MHIMKYNSCQFCHTPVWSDALLLTEWNNIYSSKSLPWLNSAKSCFQGRLILIRYMAKHHFLTIFFKLVNQMHFRMQIVFVNKSEVFIVCRSKDICKFSLRIQRLFFISDWEICSQLWLPEVRRNVGKPNVAWLVFNAFSTFTALFIGSASMFILPR